MESYGVIIQQLRTLAGLSVQNTAKKIGRSKGWLSEVENNSGNSRISELEFNRIVDILNGTKHRPMFKTWAATAKNRDQVARTFDGAVLKYIRIKKEITLLKASKLTRLSVAYISKLETGVKSVSLEIRNSIMRAYGYSPSSFKNLSTDPTRSKVVPVRFKLEILLNVLDIKDLNEVFKFAEKFSISSDSCSAAKKEVEV